MHLLNVLKIIILLNLFSLLQTQTINKPSTITLGPDELPNCSILKHTSVSQENFDLSNRELVIVSTIDGKITAIDTTDRGNILWSKDTGHILSSTIHLLKFKYKGVDLEIVQSLDGMLYAIKDNKVKKIPLNAENFLKHSYRISKDIVISGGKEKRTYGFNLKTGEIQYECGLEGCRSANSGLGTILVALKETQTLRGIDARTGSEKFNYTVGDIDLSLVTQEGGCAGFTNNSISIDSSSNNQMNYKISKIESKVLAYNGEGNLVWSHVLKAPIIRTWIFKKGVLSPLNLFDTSIVANINVDYSPTYFIGSYKQNLYIQLPQDTNALDIYQPNEADLFSYYITGVSYHDKESSKQHDNNALATLDPQNREDAVFGAYFYNELEDIKDDENTTKCINKIITLPFNNTEAFFSFRWPTLIIIVNLVLTCSVWVVYHYCFTTRTYESAKIRSQDSKFNRSKRKHFKPLRKRSKSTSKEVLTYSSEPDSGENDNNCITRRKRTKSEDMYNERVKKLSLEGSIAKITNRKDSNKSTDISYIIESDDLTESKKEDIKNDVSLIIESDASTESAAYSTTNTNYSFREDSDVEDDTSSTSNQSLKKYSLNEESESSLSGTDLESGCPEPSDSSFVIEFMSSSFKSTSKHTKSKSLAPKTHSPKRVSQRSPSSSSESQSFSRFFSDFNDFHRLGQGGFGLVFRAYKNLIGKHYAIKVIKFPQNNKRQEKIIRELKLLGNLEHKRIVRYYDGWVETHEEQEVVEKLKQIPCDNSDNYEPTFFNTTSNRGVLDQNNSRNLSLLFIQMELCKEKSLNDWLLDSQSRDPIVALDYFYQIVEAVEFIHKKNIIHRDIKPSNIFLSQKNTIKLGDFGLARDLTELSHLSTNETNKIKTGGEQLTQDIGTWYYLSPELIHNQAYNEKADIFSLGIVFMEISTSTNTISQKEEKLINFRNRNIIPDDIVDTHKIELLRLLTSKDQNKRPSAKEIMLNQVFHDIQSKHISLNIS